MCWVVLLLLQTWGSLSSGRAPDWSHADQPRPRGPRGDYFLRVLRVFGVPPRGPWRPLARRADEGHSCKHPLCPQGLEENPDTPQGLHQPYVASLPHFRTNHFRQCTLFILKNGCAPPKPGCQLRKLCLFPAITRRRALLTPNTPMAKAQWYKTPTCSSKAWFWGLRWSGGDPQNSELGTEARRPLALQTLQLGTPQPLSSATIERDLGEIWVRWQLRPL